MAKGKYVEGYNRLEDGRNIWLFQCSLDEKSGEGFSIVEEHLDAVPFKPNEFIEWGGPEWVRSSASRKRIRAEMRAGDWCFLYQAKPDRAVVGVARIGQRKSGSTGEDGSFPTDWTHPVEHLPRHRIEEDSVLAQSEFIRVKQGTVFRVSPKEALRLIELLVLPPNLEKTLFSKWKPPTKFVSRYAPVKRRSISAPILSDAAMRQAIEEHAVEIAARIYKSNGYRVEVKGKPYDLLCTSAFETVHVEVKGTTKEGSKVILTRNEVTHAIEGATRTDLVIVSNITTRVVTPDRIETSGGVVKQFKSWTPAASALEPIQYEYSVPPEGGVIVELDYLAS